MMRRAWQWIASRTLSLLAAYPEPPVWPPFPSEPAPKPPTDRRSRYMPHQGARERARRRGELQR